jgi:predicted flap endonuclease-1-like 5' DNA nuclease
MRYNGSSAILFEKGGAMNWWSFIIGVIVGLVLYWLLDKFYWGPQRQARVAELEARLHTCHDEVKSLQGELATAKAAAVKPVAPVMADVKAAAPKAAAAKAAAPKAAVLKTPAPKGIPAQDLAAIRGIGPVFEQKLYEAHVGTYAELAALSEAQLKAIIKPQEWQEFHYETWKGAARKLAEKTGTVDAVWNGIIPDDLTAIKGIGEVFEQRLFDAGILTFGNLASKSVAELEAIIQPRNWQKVELAAWIAEAQARAAKVK